ncbi:kelch-like protein 31 [Callorhinchus milii]|uniref:Kelch-like family member 31 n=1 Tax=Callorhinchus milii TaxID=7868 RepID=A0A4W3JNR0_CALMI|nr:kelch-like protein 31 [Callorhinchus milii]XP_007892246.1 kelch-like protein 31 [Callorhinchus milii]XP_007892247.1 kelch-like protein 31 [Callorhinchus milii]|eukprot:gi/632953144/ref/XP_007892245.1/ PREDICTED: kelch-like protein 31 [Callorhinchus milii]
MAPKKKSFKKNKAENKETTVIVEESTIIHLNGVNGLVDGGNGFSRISTEMSDSTYGLNLLEVLNKMKQEKFLCDLTIATKSKSFDVHKVVMASCSEYFRNILKKDPTTHRVDVNDISAVGLNAVITYAYSGKLTLSLYTIGNIIATANQLQIHSLIKMCCDFLMQEINVENCMYIVNIAETYGLRNTMEAAHNFIRDHFIEFSEKDQFLKLTFEQIIKFMMDDALLLPSEITAFQIAMKWLDFDSKRAKYAADLLSTIRFCTISAQDLVNYVQTVPRMMQDTECHRFLVDAMNYHLLPYQQNTLQCRRTKVRSGLKVLVMVAGRPALTEKSLSRDIIYRDPERGWNKLSEMPYKSFNQCVAVMDGFLYVAGGEDQNDARNQAKHAVSNVCRYDPRFNSWIHLGNMVQRRTHFSLNVFNGLLFAIGGRNPDGPLASVECYVPATNHWQLKAPLEVPRCCHAGAVVDGKILVTGGYINNAYSRLACAYDPSADSWQDKANLSTPRGWHCAISLFDRVYVLGGSQLGGKGERIDVLPVECYNPSTAQWSQVAPLHVGVSTAGAATIDGKIYVVGGWNEVEKKYKKCVQCYNPNMNEWIDEDDLTEATVGVSCCVVTLPTQKTRESRNSSASSVPVSI